MTAEIKQTAADGKEVLDIDGFPVDAKKSNYTYRVKKFDLGEELERAGYSDIITQGREHDSIIFDKSKEVVSGETLIAWLFFWEKNSPEEDPRAK